MRRFAAMLLLAFLVPAYGDGLGRLFFTPGEREALDALRARVPARAAREETTTAEFSGVIVRDGRVVWSKGLPASGRVRPGSRPGEAEVSLPEGKRRLSVGQRLEAGGQVSDLLDRPRLPEAPTTEPTRASPPRLAPGEREEEGS